VRPLERPISLAQCLQNVAWATLDAGDTDTAAAILDETLELFRLHGDPAIRCDALHSAGTVALDRERFSDAEKYFAACLRITPMQIAALPDVVEGLAIVAAWTDRPIRALRLAAAATAARTSSVRNVPEPMWRRRVEAAMTSARHRTGVHEAARAAAEGGRLSMLDAISYALQDHLPGPAAATPLTARELQVARLVAQGLTNQQIAGRLRFSARTAESHLEHIRGKLGVRSRAEIAAWVSALTDS
jgi:DNA-binding CsgD family transcriptional regulator